MAERTTGDASPQRECKANCRRSKRRRCRRQAKSTEAAADTVAPSAADTAAPSVADAPSPAAASAPSPRLHLRPRHKRQVLLAASVALAAGLGALFGSLASGAWAPPSRDVAGLEERKAMQQSIAHLTKQVALLRANLEKANKAAHAEIASISARLDEKAAPDVTGSLGKTTAAVPVPLPRPAPHIAAAASRPAVVHGWSVRDVRDGYVYVQGHGDIYQVVPGAPLPGLGRVQSIKRQGGRWVVETPRGLIVSLRDRHYFE